MDQGRKSLLTLGYGVMVAQQFLELFEQVRVLLSQQVKHLKTTVIMELVHKRQRFNRNAVASSRGSYVMHAHKQMLSENHLSEKSLTLFTE